MLQWLQVMNPFLRFAEITSTFLDLIIPKSYTVSHLRCRDDHYSDFLKFSFGKLSLTPDNSIKNSLETERSSKRQQPMLLKVQGVPPGHQHLNIGRIELHSSMTFIWVYSVCSPLGAVHFFNRSIHLRKTACMVTFSILSRTPLIAARSWSGSLNERPARHLLTYPKR
jgi:hypothetical protein